MTLSGTKRYSDKSGEYYLKNILSNSKKNIAKKLQFTNHKSQDYDCKKNKIIQNKQLESFLTPIPMNPKKSIIKNNYDKKALNNAQKTAVFLRRVEYSSKMRKNTQNKKINPDFLRKIIIIQKWWKTLYLIILLQKNIRGFLSRTKLIESLEKQESFINMLLLIDYLHKKIVFKRFLKKLVKGDKKYCLKNLNKILSKVNMRIYIKKWENISLKENKDILICKLKNCFVHWKKNVDKFTIVKSILKNYKNNNNNDLIFSSFKKFKEIIEKRGILKSLILFKKENLNNPKIIKSKNNNKTKNSKNLKVEKKENPKNNIEKRNKVEKESEKEEPKKSKKTLVFLFKKKHQINNIPNDNVNQTELFIEENNFINENYEMMLFKNKRNSVKNFDNPLKKKFKEIKTKDINEMKVVSSREKNNDLLNMNKTFTNVKLDKINETDIRKKKRKKIINEEKIDNKKNKNNMIKKENNKIIKNSNKESNSKAYLNNLNKELENIKNENIIIDPPFQDILKENTQASIKEKEENLKLLSKNKEDEIFNKNEEFNKMLEQDKLIEFETINILDDDIYFKNNIDEKNNNEENKNEKKKIKEVVITFDKKINNDFNFDINKIEENQNKEINNLEKVENTLNENLKENNEELKNKRKDKITSPTLVKKNNILQTTIQFQKPTQNILELKQKNNLLDKKEEDIEILNINEEIENISKFKPPSKIKEIVIENLNLNKQNNDFYTGYDNIFINDDNTMTLNHSLSNYNLGHHYLMNTNQNNIYIPNNERFIQCNQNLNNEVFRYPINQINSYQYRKMQIPDYQIIDYDNNNNLIHKKTLSSNNLFQYNPPHLNGMTFNKKIINYDTPVNNNNLINNQNLNNNNPVNQSNLNNKIYMRRVNICPPKNLNKTFQQQGINSQK